MIVVTKEQYDEWLASNQEGRAEGIEETYTTQNGRDYFLKFTDTKTGYVLAARHDYEDEDKYHYHYRYYLQEGNTND